MRNQSRHNIRRCIEIDTQEAWGRSMTSYSFCVAETVRSVTIPSTAMPIQIQVRVTRA